MQFRTLVYALAAISTSSALPINDTAATSKLSKDFYLKSSLLPGPGASNHRFNNLYVQPYHTGAGLNDVVLEAAKPTATSSQAFFLNGTSLQLNLSSEDPGTPWTFINVEDAVEYSGWQPCEINVGYGVGSAYSHFSINGTGLQWTDSPKAPKSNEFGGWRVCDWWHGVPQLFWILSAYDDKVPSSCSNVDLIPEYVTY